MNCSNLKSSGMLAALTAGIVVLTFAGAGVPAKAQTPTVVYTFTASDTPQNPYAWAIAQGRDGDLYSTTCATFEGTSVVFKVTPAGILSTVDNTSPACSYGVTLGADGNFYGAASSGGTDNVGQVYKVTPGGVVTVLHSFTAGSDGSVPIAPPIESANGVFYGTTTSIGVADSTAYSVTPGGVFTTLHTFTGADGQNVYGALIQGTDGNFYGASAAGGTSNDGVIFKMTPTGTVTVLHNFAGTDGSVGYWGLIQGADGNFYGTTNQGGTDGAGVIYKITSGGTYTVLYNFTGSATGNLPRSSLMQATNGTFYGVTSYQTGPFNFGTIYSFTTGGAFNTLYTFANQSMEGDQPSSPLRQHTNGLLYGVSYIGGDLNCGSLENDGELVDVVGCGTVYSLDIGAKAFAGLVSSSGKEGAKIGILGKGFSSSSVVKFDGVQATTVTRTGSTFLSATAPAGALTGAVTVTTGSTTLTSNKVFRVTPTATSFSPPSGPVGTLVTINGTGLTQTTKVAFNGKLAAFTMISDIEIKATVPTGATTGKIGVATKGGSAASATSFAVN
jgi:uncharacterized repeat protein (TIGR03803 family)